MEALSAVIHSFISEIDCTAVNWRVTNSSIQGTVEGLFSNATASNVAATDGLIHVSSGGGNVSFTGLVPGATYQVLLVYETQNRPFNQCEHNLTIRKYKPVSPH